MVTVQLNFVMTFQIMHVAVAKIQLAEILKYFLNIFGEIPIISIYLFITKIYKSYYSQINITTSIYNAMYKASQIRSIRLQYDLQNSKKNKTTYNIYEIIII